jgi:adenosylcobinamide-phosphate synthase
MVKIFLEYPVDFWALCAIPLGLLLGFLLERFARKPAPSRAIGPLVDLAERGLRASVARRRGGPKGELLAGSVLALVVVGLVGGLAWLSVELLAQVGGPANLIGRSLLIACGISIGRIGREVLRASEALDLTTARRAAVEFVGLEATRLDTREIRRACVRSVGERANRLVIAPLFWLAIAGPAGLWGYQAVDTLGRRFAVGGPRSRYLGFTSERLDDLANFAPERLTWLLISLSAALLGEDGVLAFRFGLRGRRPQPSRPGALAAAALDGALGVQSNGRLEAESPEPRTVRRALRIMQVAGLHAAALALAYRIVFIGH